MEYSNAHRAQLWGRANRQSGWRRLGMAVVTAVLTLGVALSATSSAAPVSDYELAQAAPFNQVERYPVEPLPSSPSFRPNGGWIGRLILPSESEYADSPGDWVWFEVWHSPDNEPNLLRRTLKLTWQPTEANQTYVDSVSRNLAFNRRAEQALEQGTIVPERLNGRQQVGPLQSLAGARPNDDVTVRLFDDHTELGRERGEYVLRTDLEPLQITGREYGLVKLIEPNTRVEASFPPACPGVRPCPKEYFWAQHFNPDTGDFSGPIETLRIPQQPILNGERFVSNIRQLTTSPAGRAGWYVYGSRDAEGVFTVQALKPRVLVQLDPDDQVAGLKPGLDYIDQQNWANVARRKGMVQKVLVGGRNGGGRNGGGRNGEEGAIAPWRLGDRALVIHLFGGIGGDNPEATPGGTVTGHFAYGLAEVVREPIAQELQLQLLYQQLYAHNPSGIVAGAHDWTAYMGDMQRGWLGLRPVSDVVVKLDALTTPFEFGDTTVSLFDALLTQAQGLAARYRTGDGTGLAAATPAAASVQDSNQALYLAIEAMQRQIRTDPAIAAWLEAHPDSPELARLGQLEAVGKALETMLTPYGVVRPNWNNDADTLAGIAPTEGFQLTRGVVSALLSWRTMMPRWGHDEVARVLLENGAQLWFLRTNLVGGDDPRVEPIPPTNLFGLMPTVGRSVQRLTDAVVTRPSGVRVGLAGLGLGLYAAAALRLGRRNGFLHRQIDLANFPAVGLHSLRLFLVPALVEEILFRVLLLPHPLEAVSAPRWLFLAVVSGGAFGLWHWLLGKTLRRSAQATFCDPRFLLLAGGLGLLLTLLYGLTGSLWLVVTVHWLVAVVWIYGLGGRQRLPHLEAGQRPAIHLPGWGS
ncbi:MAG TPA: CPBP family glutamic-type intramembrane protease [Nodosilinea sp.]|nr:CPBP family glutamic-type intramembrane protease [Nodosilinea sp.]